MKSEIDKDAASIFKLNHSITDVKVSKKQQKILMGWLPCQGFS